MKIILFLFSFSIARAMDEKILPINPPTHLRYQNRAGTPYPVALITNSKPLKSAFRPIVRSPSDSNLHEHHVQFNKSNFVIDIDLINRQKKLEERLKRTKSELDDHKVELARKNKKLKFAVSTAVTSVIGVAATLIIHFTDKCSKEA